MKIIQLLLVSSIVFFVTHTAYADAQSTNIEIKAIEGGNIEELIDYDMNIHIIFPSGERSNVIYGYSFCRLMTVGIAKVLIYKWDECPHCTESDLFYFSMKDKASRDEDTELDFLIAQESLKIARENISEEKGREFIIGCVRRCVIEQGYIPTKYISK